MTNDRKAELLRAVVACLEPAPEIRKLIAFGSFLNSESPRDLDIAVVQDSDEGYLPLALKYRRMAEPVAERVPLDIIPLRHDAEGAFMDEILRGEVIYER